MEEYSRILIEEYCWSHNSVKSERLAKLVEVSYDMFTEISDSDAIFLEKAIASEKNSKLRKALKDLD